MWSEEAISLDSGLLLMTKPSLFRHFAAIVYDLLLLIGFLFFATAILLPLNGGEAFNSRQVFYPLYLLTVSFLFYGWFWTHGGQTLGLRAWKIKVLSENGNLVNWRQAFIRFVIAFVSWGCLGLGYLWPLFDKSKRTWHDMASKTGLYLESTDNADLSGQSLS